MRLVPGRLCGISIVFIIALAAVFNVSAGAELSSSQHVIMPPADFSLSRSETGHFDVYYDSLRVTDASDAIVGAEKAYNTVTGFYGPYGSTIRVILAADHQQYVGLLRNYFVDVNVSEDEVASAWGDGDGATIVIEAPDQLPNFQAVMAYELSLISMRTQLIDNKYSVPDWFSRGVSIYISGDISGADEAAVNETCQNGKLMTVAQMEYVLERSADPATNAQDVRLASAQSGMLMQYVASKFGNDSIKLILQDFGTSADLDRAFTKRIGYTPEDINTDWGSVLKGQLNVENGLVLAQRVYGRVLDADGKPVANETIAFTCMRNDSSVFGRTYTAMTNGTGYYKLAMTYGPFNVHLDRPGYGDVNDNFTLQRNEAREYDVTLKKAGSNVQNILASPEVAGDQTVYIALGILNAAAILLIAFVFWRARK